MCWNALRQKPIFPSSAVTLSFSFLPSSLFLKPALYSSSSSLVYSFLIFLPYSDVSFSSSGFHFSPSSGNLLSFSFRHFRAFLWRDPSFLFFIFLSFPGGTPFSFHSSFVHFTNLTIVLPSHSFLNLLRSLAALLLPSFLYFFTCDRRLPAFLCLFSLFSLAPHLPPAILIFQQNDWLPYSPWETITANKIHYIATHPPALNLVIVWDPT